MPFLHNMAAPDDPAGPDGSVNDPALLKGFVRDRLTK
jgi:hypothetical protein